MKKFKCKMEIRFTPDTLKEAAKVITHEVKENELFRNAVLANIAASVRENMLPFESEDEIAENILNNLVGED